MAAILKGKIQFGLVAKNLIPGVHEKCSQWSSEWSSLNPCIVRRLLTRLLYFTVVTAQQMQCYVDGVLCGSVLKRL